MKKKLNFAAGKVRRMNWTMSLALALLAVFLPGCANVKKYSVLTYQGPMPVHDTYHAETLE